MLRHRKSLYLYSFVIWMFICPNEICWPLIFLWAFSTFVIKVRLQESGSDLLCSVYMTSHVVWPNQIALLFDFGCLNAYDFPNGYCWLNDFYIDFSVQNMHQVTGYCYAGFSLHNITCGMRQLRLTFARYLWTFDE